jgi:hypothetical protein
MKNLEALAALKTGESFGESKKRFRINRDFLQTETFDVNFHKFSLITVDYGLITTPRTRHN